MEFELASGSGAAKMPARIAVLFRWFIETLARFEGRPSDSVAEAVSSFGRWAQRTAEIGCESPLLGARERWKGFAANCGPVERMLAGFPPQAEPTWEANEVELVIGAAQMMAAVRLVPYQSLGAMELAGIYLAEATAAQSAWADASTIGNYRRASEDTIAVANHIARLEAAPIADRLLREEKGRGGRSKRDNNAKMIKARKLALRLLLEWRGGKHRKLSRPNGKLNKLAFGLKVQRACGAPKNPATVRAWVAAWQLQLDAGQTPTN